MRDLRLFAAAGGLLVAIVLALLLWPSSATMVSARNWLASQQFYPDHGTTHPGSYYGKWEIVDVCGAQHVVFRVEEIPVGSGQSSAATQKTFLVGLGVVNALGLWDRAGEHALLHNLEVNTQFCSYEQIDWISGWELLGEESRQDWTEIYYLAMDSDLSKHIGSIWRNLSARQSKEESTTTNVVALIDGEGDNDSRIVVFRRFGNAILPLRELNVGKPETLRSLVEWTRTMFPAAHYSLTIAGHGSPLGGVGGDGHYPGLNFGEDELKLNEYQDAITSWFDIIYLYSCSLGTMEVTHELRNLAGYLIVTEMPVWFGSDMTLGGEDDDGYMPSDARSRAIQVAAAYELAFNSSWQNPIIPRPAGTIAVLDMAKHGATIEGITRLARALRDNYPWSLMKQLRSPQYVQYVESDADFQETDSDSFLDLWSLADALARQASAPAITSAAHSLKTALDAYVIWEESWNGDLKGHDWDLTDAHGVSIFFPNYFSIFYTESLCDFLSGTASWIPGLAETAGESSTSESVGWGDVLISFVSSEYPDAPIVAEPPKAVPPLESANAYIPTVQRSLPAVPTPTPRPAEMVQVPAGRFLMGCNTGGRPCADDSKPLHEVDLSAFWIDKYEVTNARYARCVASGVCTPPQEASSFTRPAYYGNTQYDTYPVINVDWQQAKAFCQWEGKRLPTEAEWEKAARGTDARSWPWGEQAPINSLLNYRQNVGDTTAVGSYPGGASPYGALDMSGNVWEWVNDYYQDDYYSESPSSNPQGPAGGTYRVVRGGSWHSESGQRVQTFFRLALRPVDQYEDYYGFRCARSQ